MGIGFSRCTHCGHRALRSSVTGLSGLYLSWLQCLRQHVFAGPLLLLLALVAIVVCGYAVPDAGHRPEPARFRAPGAAVEPQQSRPESKRRLVPLLQLDQRLTTTNELPPVRAWPPAGRRMSRGGASISESDDGEPTVPVRTRAFTVANPTEKTSRAAPRDPRR